MAPVRADSTSDTHWYNPLSWWNSPSSTQVVKPSPEEIRAQKRQARAQRAAQKRAEAEQRKKARNAQKAQQLADREREKIARSPIAHDGAVIETQRGDIAIALYEDAAPKTVANFKALAESGFYNHNMVFHRVVPGFVAQTGDPTGTGYGGSDKRIALEVNNKLSHDAKGVVAMARGAAPDSATSQFYITLAPQPSLDGKYAIFGRVISGLDALDKIQKGDRLYGVRLITLSSGSASRLTPPVDARATSDAAATAYARSASAKNKKTVWYLRPWKSVQHGTTRAMNWLFE
ncbi:MAG: peptidylprolyl isomerase [Vampirovibrionales bacterium]|nr:peptidylprolyl isomerase [Vampirovibrionales bacterium]